MIRFILIVLLLLVGAVLLLGYSSQTLPDWYQAEQSRGDQVTQQLSAEIDRQGTAKFLGDKFSQVMNGELTLSEAEFNAVLLASLQSSRDGRKLLAVSDAVNADLTNDGIEFGAVINLDKAAQMDAKAKKAVDKLVDTLPFLNKSKVYIAVQGRPIARNGNLAFTEDISVQIGSIPISHSILKQLGVPLYKVSNESLPLRYMSIKAVSTNDDEIVLQVLPRL